MSYEQCRSILRLVGVLTVAFGLVWIVYTGVSLLGTQVSMPKMPALQQSLRESSRQLALSVGLWKLLAQVAVPGMGILLLASSDGLARLVVGSAPRARNSGRPRPPESRSRPPPSPGEGGSQGPASR